MQTEEIRIRATVKFGDCEKILKKKILIVEDIKDGNYERREE